MAVIGCEISWTSVEENADATFAPSSVQENEHRLNSNMKCSIDGSTARIPYVGTCESEVLPLNQVLSEVKKLVPAMHEKSQGGSVCQSLSKTSRQLYSP